MTTIKVHAYKLNKDGYYDAKKEEGDPLLSRWNLSEEAEKELSEAEKKLLDVIEENEWCLDYARLGNGFIFAAKDLGLMSVDLTGIDKWSDEELAIYEAYDPDEYHELISKRFQKPEAVSVGNPGTFVQMFASVLQARLNAKRAARIELASPSAREYLVENFHNAKEAYNKRSEAKSKLREIRDEAYNEANKAASGVTVRLPVQSTLIVEGQKGRYTAVFNDVSYEIPDIALDQFVEAIEQATNTGTSIDLSKKQTLPSRAPM